MQRVELFLNRAGFTTYGTRMGFYFYWLTVFTIICKITNRESLSTDELRALEKHAKADSINWGITIPAIKQMTRENRKFLDSRKDIIIKFILSEQGKYKQPVKFYPPLTKLYSGVQYFPKTNDYYPNQNSYH